MWQYNQTSELYHSGVMGMKWGHRKQYAKAVGQFEKNNIMHPILSTKANKQSIHADKLSTRLKRNSLYQKTNEIEDVNRRTANLVKEKNKQKSLKSEQKSLKSEQKKQFRADVKMTKKNGLIGEFKVDKYGIVTPKQFYNSKNQKIGMDYANKVMSTAGKEKEVSTLVKKAAMVTTGMAVATLYMQIHKIQ